MTVRKAMTFGSVDVKTIDHLINDPNIILEQKFDGTRAMCVVNILADAPFNDVAEMTIEFLSRSGAPLKHTAATQHTEAINEELAIHITALLRDEILNIGDEIVFDGEIMIDTGKYILFDMPYQTGMVGPEDRYDKRRGEMSALMGSIESPVEIGAMAQTTENKQALFDLVTQSNGEGVMAKDRTAAYIEGKRVNHSLKCKFVKTADVVVMDWHRARDGKNKHGEPTGSETGWIKFGVYNNDGELEHVGRCSIIGKPAVVNGDVIEVKYLYRGAGGALVQPTMIKVRDDRLPESCTYDQFPDYDKSILL